MRTRAFVVWMGLSALGLAPAQAETLPVWWAAAIAPPNIDALEEAFDADLPTPFEMQGPRAARLTVTTCDEAADAASRHFTATDLKDAPLVQKCQAMAHVLYAAEAGTSTFRLPVGGPNNALVPGGAPKPLGMADVQTLPAMLAPIEGCGFDVLALRAADSFWSLLRFAHVYGAANPDDGRDADTLNGKTDKALKVEETQQGLTLTQNGVTVTLSLLALGDFDADGTEDALILKSGGGDTAGLHFVSQFRAGAVMRLKNLPALYNDLLQRCPDLMLDLARTSSQDAEGAGEE